MDKIKTIFKDKRNYVDVVIIAVSVIGTILSLIAGQHFNSFICGIFTMLVIQNFVTKLLTLDKLNENIEKLKIELEFFNTANDVNNLINGISIYSQDKAINLKEVLNDANEEVFVSGVYLSSLIRVKQEIFMKAKAGVKIKLVAVNMNDSDIKKSYNSTFKIQPDPNRSSLADFLDKENIELRLIDTLPTAMYIAADYSKSLSNILVTHFLFHEDSSRAPRILISPHNDFYNLYRTQIHKIWDASFEAKLENFNL